MRVDRFRREQSGQTLVIVALMLIPLLGFTWSLDSGRASDSALSRSVSQLVKPCCRATASRASSSVTVDANTSSSVIP